MLAVGEAIRPSPRGRWILNSSGSSRAGLTSGCVRAELPPPGAQVAGLTSSRSDTHTHSRGSRAAPAPTARGGDARAGGHRSPEAERERGARAQHGPREATLRPQWSRSCRRTSRVFLLRVCRVGCELLEAGAQTPLGLGQPPEPGHQIRHFLGMQPGLQTHSAALNEDSGC